MEEQAALDNTDNLTLSLLLRKCITHDCTRDRIAPSFRNLNPDGEDIYVHAFCDRMDCHTCVNHKIDVLREKLEVAVRERHLYHCYTFTLRKRRNHYLAFKRIMRKLRNLLACLRRKHGPSIDYIWVKSIGEQGGAHLHFMTHLEIDMSWLRDYWKRATGAEQVFYVLNEPKHIPRLVTYLLKNWVMAYLGGVKRKRMSASKRIDISIKPKKSDKATQGQWERSSKSTRQIAVEVYGRPEHDYPENPRRIVVPASKKPERSEGSSPQAADSGRRAEADAAGGGRSTRGKSAPGGQFQGMQGAPAHMPTSEEQQ